MLLAARYGVKRASPLVEQGMTYGYYQGGAAGEKAFYYYNGSNLETRSLISAGFLIYHELIPGHHFHLALVRENQQLSAYRRGISMTAFSEGWANYAAFLAREIGMLSDPYDRYGWLLSNAYISVRLVVDTGLNHKGWSLQEASNYMLENTNADKSEVAAEVLRYSVDIPAQALSYKLGYDKIRELRQTAEIALGDVGGIIAATGFPGNFQFTDLFVVTIGIENSVQSGNFADGAFHHHVLELLLHERDLAGVDDNRSDLGGILLPLTTLVGGFASRQQHASCHYDKRPFHVKRGYDTYQ